MNRTRPLAIRCAVKLTTSVSLPTRRQAKTGPGDSHQGSNWPGDHQVQRDNALQPCYRSRLSGPDPTTVLADVEEEIDLPAHALFNRLSSRCQRFGAVIGQQAPPNRNAVGACVAPLGHHAGTRIFGPLP